MTTPAQNFNRDAYLELIKRSITNYHALGGETPFEEFRCVTHYDVDQGQWKIDRLARPATLLSKKQLDLLEFAILELEERKIPGDFLEAGIWRGGVIIYLRALINAYNITGRRVFAADSFAGIPMNVRAANDPVDAWRDRWVASLDEVKQNIERFGLLDDRIEFVPGFFADSLPSLANERFALIRLDSDSYDSVETSLEHLYPLLSREGIVVIDDWHLPGCRQAVLDYRSRHQITEELGVVDSNAYWVKQQDYGFPGRR